MEGEVLYPFPQESSLLLLLSVKENPESKHTVLKHGFSVGLKCQLEIIVSLSGKSTN
jgi:hypothetical protein